MRALVVNCSAPSYNLGALKLADWLRSEGHAVDVRHGREFRTMPLFFLGYDVVALSVIFSWHAPIARDIAVVVRANADVWCGGPGVFDLADWWLRETGSPAVRGLDPRFDKQRGDYRYTFAARGCPVKCSFCNVWRLEGPTFTYDWDFRPAPVLCDNNISAQKIEFQEHVLRTYAEAGVELRDANSGFEPQTFDEGTFARWEPVLKATDAPWRFAFDELLDERGKREAAAVERMMKVLAPLRSKRKRVWVLAGNEPIEACYQRAQQVIAWGGEPWCQYKLPLNWLGDPQRLEPKFDWTWRLGRDFCRYYNRRLWRSTPSRPGIRISDYEPRIGQRPFRTVLGGAA